MTRREFGRGAVSLAAVAGLGAAGAGAFMRGRRRQRYANATQAEVTGRIRWRVTL